ncbi:unnamed protein product [Clavelina lepadiformis]|uniref:Uncharacterized protein n=1 Tax=Clavelina lepadiformis TaxID=159417 RepID=A0ABP0GFS1_CLALP
MFWRIQPQNNSNVVSYEFVRHASLDTQRRKIRELGSYCVGDAQGSRETERGKSVKSRFENYFREISPTDRDSSFFVGEKFFCFMTSHFPQLMKARSTSVTSHNAVAYEHFEQLRTLPPSEIKGEAAVVLITSSSLTFNLERILVERKLPPRN